MDAHVRAGAVAVLGLGAAAPGVRGQTMCWTWEVTDTAGNTGFVGAGESAILTLWGSFNPVNHGFAQAGPYAITGDGEWGAGTVDGFANRLFFTSGFGTLGAGNSIIAIQNFQLSEVFNPGYRDENPILLYSIEWTPNRYEGQLVMITNSAPDAHVYTDAVGHSILYAGDPACGSVTFRVVPAPGGAAMVVSGSLVICRRRR